MMRIVAFVFFYGLIPYGAFRGAIAVTGSALVSSLIALVCTLLTSLISERIFKKFSNRL